MEIQRDILDAEQSEEEARYGCVLIDGCRGDIELLLSISGLDRTPNWSAEASQIPPPLGDEHLLSQEARCRPENHQSSL